LILFLRPKPKRERESWAPGASFATCKGARLFDSIVSIGENGTSFQGIRDFPESPSAPRDQFLDGWTADKKPPPKDLFSSEALAFNTLNKITGYQ
jgi:hypothetical protein